MNLFKKLLLVLCLAISIQPAYGWGWDGIVSPLKNFFTSSIPSLVSHMAKTASEHKTALGGCSRSNGSICIWKKLFW